MTNHISFYNEYITDITSEGKQYSIFYNPKIEEFFVYESKYENGRLRCKNPSTNFSALDKIWEIYNDVPADQKTLTQRAFNRKVAEERRERVLKAKANRKPKGRPPKPYLTDAALWSIVNRRPGENDSSLIKRIFERYKAESPNLKSFTISIKNKREKIKKEYKRWQQENSIKNIDPLETFAKKS